MTHKTGFYSRKLLQWYDKQGRKDLPWRRNTTPYRVWISEIMLQQTQVKTVIPYFDKFLTQFPNLKSLANASLDQVFQIWAGLGYYARARNLHKTAQIIVKKFKGTFPDSMDDLIQLPGIGRSTAGAIRSIAFQKPASILDGNVKRILARWFAIREWPGETKVAQKLWQIADELLPKQRNADYSQALMDLGATICTKMNPKCDVCPVVKCCLSYQENLQREIPAAKPARAIPTKKAQLLILMNDAHEILLERRPPTGIWGGLWSLPQCTSKQNLMTWCRKNLNCRVQILLKHPTFRHTFTHFHLELTPVTVKLLHWDQGVREEPEYVWYNLKSSLVYGVPSPIKRLIQQLAGEIYDT